MQSQTVAHHKLASLVIADAPSAIRDLSAQRDLSPFHPDRSRPCGFALAGMTIVSDLFPVNFSHHLIKSHHEITRDAFRLADNFNPVEPFEHFFPQDP